MAVNKVILVGNVGKDPETKYLDENTPVCKFSLATSEVYRNRNGEKDRTNRMAQYCALEGPGSGGREICKKGSQLYIEGRIRNRSYDDKDGIKRYISEIVCDNMQMLGKKQDDGSSYSPQNVQSNSASPQAPSQASPQSPPQSSTDQVQNGPESSQDTNNSNSGSAGDPDDLPF